MIGLAKEKAGLLYLKRRFKTTLVYRFKGVKGVPDFYLPEKGLWVEMKARDEIYPTLSLLTTEQFHFARLHQRNWILLFRGFRFFKLYKLNKDMKLRVL